MTRIRKNWSSSRGTEDVDSPSSRVVMTNDSHTGDREEKSKSPLMLQLVDEDAMHMLAAVSLESLEQDSGIRNLKRENASAQVMAAMSAKALERDSANQNVKHEREAAKVWDQPFLQGGLLGKCSKSDHWYQKLSALWSSDHGPAVLPKVSTRRETVDEEQSKSSSVADNEMIDSDLSARVERAKKGLMAAEPMHGLISGLLQVHCLEREQGTEETSRVLQDLVFAHAAGRKRRQKPWEPEVDLAGTVVEVCRTDQNTQKLVDRNVHFASDTHKRRLKILRAPLDQDTCDGNKSTEGESVKLVTDGGNENKLGLQPEMVVANGSYGNQLKAKSEEVGDDVDDRNQLKAKFEVGGNAVNDRSQLKTKLEKCGTAADDGSQVMAKLEEVENAVDDNQIKTETSQEMKTDGGDRKRFRAKQVKVTGAQKGSGEDIFPKGWKYKGLAQIAEKEEVTNGQVKKLCGRTDGHNWRCPLRVVEGFSLCQHHLNKAQAKKMGKSNQQRRQSEKSNSEEVLVSPYKSDSSTFNSSLPSDHHVPTKLRRRHKTAKLSVL